MAANNPTNVSVGKPQVGGAIFFAPTGTTLPTDAATALDAAFVNIGYAGEDGVSRSTEMETESFKAWGGETILESQTSRSEAYAFTAIEINQAALSQVYGAENVTVSEEGIAVLHTTKELPEQVMVIEVLLSGNRVQRMVVPRAKIREIGEVAFQDGGVIGYPLTYGALTDADGNTGYTYIAEITEPVGE